MLCAHLPLPALVFTATAATQHVNQQQTLPPVTLTAWGTAGSQLWAQGWKYSPGLIPHPAEEWREHSWAMHGGLLIRAAEPTNSTCLARVMTQACTSPESLLIPNSV